MSSPKLTYDDSRNPLLLIPTKCFVYVARHYTWVGESVYFPSRHPHNYSMRCVYIYIQDPFNMGVSSDSRMSLLETGALILFSPSLPGFPIESPISPTE